MDPKSQDSYTQAYNRWVSDQTPKNLADLVETFMPTINSELQQYSGSKNLLRSRAKSYVIQAIRTFDPLGSTKLNSWIVTNLKQLSRYGKRLNPIRTSEDIARNIAEYRRISGELEDRLGRAPTDDELQDETGWNKSTLEKIRKSSVPIANSASFEIADSEGEPNTPSTDTMDSMPFLQDAVYMSLNDLDRKIFDYRMGTNGKKSLSGKEIADLLKVSPAYISQRSSNIGSLLANLGK